MIFENIRYMNILQKLYLGVMAFPVMQIAAQQARPNIILIVTDQQSYNTIGAHSDMYRGSYFSTPNIDRLVKSGISFTRTYCANPVSVPSRFRFLQVCMAGNIIYVIIAVPLLRK